MKAGEQFTAWRYLTPQSQGKFLILVLGKVSDDLISEIVSSHPQAVVVRFDRKPSAKVPDFGDIVLENCSVGVACVLCDASLPFRSIPIKELHRIINVGGGTCFFISRRGWLRAFQRFLELHDFDFIQTYAVLPSFRNPRWITPLNSRFLISSAKGIFRPTKAVKRLLWKLLVNLGCLRFLPLIAIDRLMVVKKGWGNIGKKTNKQGLKRLIEDLFGQKNIEIALLTRPRRYYQKVTAQVMVQKGRILAYAKIGTTPQAKRLLKNEAAVLKKVEQLDLQTADIAHVVYIGDIKQDTVLVQSAKYPLKPGPVSLSNQHISFLAEIFNKTSKRWRFEESPLLLNLQKDIQGLSGPNCDGWTVLLQVALGKIRQRFIGQQIRLGLVHGDFAPWNTCLNKEGQLVVFDWELSFTEAVPLLDFYNFIVHTEGFLRHKRGDEILTMLLNEKGSYFKLLTKYKTAIGTDFLFDYIGFLMIYLYKTITFYLNYRSLQTQSGLDTDRSAEKLLVILWTMLNALLKLREV